MSAALLLCLGTSCGGGDDDAGADAGAAGTGAGAGAGGSTGGAAGASAGAGGGSAGSPAPVATGPLYGYFHINLIAATAVGLKGTPRPARTEIESQIRDHVEPPTAGWQMIDESGDCQLYQPDPPTCNPKCDVKTQTCAVGDQCLPIAEKQPAGTVVIEGLGEPLELEAKVLGNYTTANGLMLDYPPCMEGDPITLRADGAGQGAFTLEAPCLATLDAPEPVMLKRGTPIELRWAAPAMPELGTMHVHLDISHHGGSRGQLECDTDDDGELDIDASLIDGLIALGVSGFPSIVLTRGVEVWSTTEGSTDVSMSVATTYESPVAIDGLISCLDPGPGQCPDGQTCQRDFQCQ